MKAKDTNTFRFAMAEGGRFFSSIWRIWTNKKRNQLMIAPPSGVPLFCKVNIHFESDERFCHFALTGEYKRRMIAQGLTPPRDQEWFRKPTPPVGSIPLSLCNIILPYDPKYCGPDLRDQDSTEALVKLSPPGMGKAWVIRTFVTLDDPSRIAIPEAYQVRTTFPLATKENENVIVVTEVLDFDKAEFLQRHRTLQGDITVFGPDRDIAELLANSPIAHFWNEPRDTDNILRIWEIGNVKVTMP